MPLAWWIVVGLIAGFVAGWIVRDSGYGPIVDMVTGVVGAVAGRYLLRAVGIPTGRGLIPAVLVAAVGAAVLTVAFRLATRRAAA